MNLGLVKVIFQELAIHSMTQNKHLKGKNRIYGYAEDPVVAKMAENH